MDYKDFQSGISNDHFWFKGKEQLIKNMMGKLPLNPQSKILNVGAGVGYELQVINNFGSVWAIDQNADAVELIPKDLVVEKKVCSAYNTGYPAGFFDAVVAFDVLEHIEDDERAIAEITRVLKPEGHVIFTVPAFPFLFGMHDRALNHFRRYKKRGVKKLFTDYSSVKLGYWMSILFCPVAISRILKKNTTANESSMTTLPNILNNIFYRILMVENMLIEYGVDLPFGLTIYGIYLKSELA